MITTVTGKNQLTLPAKLAKLLDIQPGTRIRWEVAEDGSIRLHPLPSRSELVKKAEGMGRSWLRPGQSPIAELLQERVDDDFS